MYQLHKKAFISISALASIFLLCHCTEEKATLKKDAIDETKQVSIKETSDFKRNINLLSNQTNLLREDSQNPLGDILYYQPLSGDTVIIVSRTSGQAQLFVQNTFIRTIGNIGNGPNRIQRGNKYVVS
jgi:hypothetical protein